MMTDWAPIQRAIELAGNHPTHPNPRVGAVVVTQNGEVVGEGFHIAPGENHAEIMALKQAGDKAPGSDLFVTLEPCSFQGRTPPCVDAIVAAEISRVLVGVIDPDPRVSGGGIAALRSAGIEVEMWDTPAEAEKVDRAYFHYHRTGLPFTTLKYAMTLDGSVAASDGTSQWITSSEAREDAHRLRAGSDAVVIGAGTLRKDNPRLDVRLHAHTGRQPRPVIIAGDKDLPLDRQIWERQPLVVSTLPREIPSGDLHVVAGSSLPDPTATARLLAQSGYLELLLEGGPALAAAWWAAGVVTAGVVYVGSLMGGGVGRSPISGIFETIDVARSVTVVDVRRVGPDVRIDFI